MTSALAHVALYLPDLGGGGGEKFAIKLAGELTRRGTKVDFVLARREGVLLGDVPPRCRLFCGSGLSIRKKFGPLLRYLKAERPQAIISAMDASNVAGLARALARVPTKVVVVLQGTLSAELACIAPRRRMLFRLLKPLYRLSDAIVGVSEGVMNDAASLLSVPRSWLHVIPNPVVSPELYRAAEEPVDHPWLAVPRTVPTLLAVGRLHPQKDFPNLLRAFRTVRDQRPARLIILGEGDLRAELEAERARLGLTDDVQFPGFVANPWAWLAKADLFCLSSIWEGLPTVVIEALAVGTPVVATDCPHGPREILRQGEFGTLVPVGDPDALARGILDSLERPREAAILRARGAEYSIENSTDQYERLIQRLLAGFP